MIGKVLRGQRPAGLIRYLYGPGRREEHRDPHLVAGWRDPAELEPPLRPGGRRDFRRLTGLLTQPHAALGPRGLDRPVWHCVVRAAPGDRLLSDAEWGDLARDIMDRTGLAPHGQDDEAIRWVAVRHAPDHIHIVGTLARQDGARPQFWNDYYRVREACHAAEDGTGCGAPPRPTAPRDAAPPARSTRRPAARDAPKRPGSRCAARSPPRRPDPAARKSSSPGWARRACWSAPGTAPVTRARSPATPSPCPATRPGPGERCGSAAGSSPPT